MKLRAVHLALAVAILVAAAALLNPSADQHRARIKDSVAERSQLAALLRLGNLAAFVAHYHSLGVASYTTSNEQLVSIGAFGVVIVLDDSSRR